MINLVELEALIGHSKDSLVANDATLLESHAPTAQVFRVVIVEYGVSPQSLFVEDVFVHVRLKGASLELAADFARLEFEHNVLFHCHVAGVARHRFALFSEML